MEPSPFKPIADAIIAHATSGATSDEPLWAEHYDPGFASVEADGMTHTGLDEIREKHKQWYEQHTVHAFGFKSVHFGQTGFGIVWTMDVEAKDGSWPRMEMDELAIYTVANGKVVREEFWMPPMG
ncbi:MAG: SnoaL-like domain-containing protein [Planctomycetota bacterium]